jgi:hypothetical protein
MVQGEVSVCQENTDITKVVEEVRGVEVIMRRLLTFILKLKQIVCPLRHTISLLNLKIL